MRHASHASLGGGPESRRVAVSSFYGGAPAQWTNPIENYRLLPVSLVVAPVIEVGQNPHVATSGARGETDRD